MRATRRRDGFTLIELSIVLVIIGLIIGGIVAGKELIRQGELRQVISDMNRYTAAVNTFREKYQYLPGYIPTATNFWGLANPYGSASASDNYTTSCFNGGSADIPIGSKLTCNGNGNGKISGNSTCDNTDFNTAVNCDYEQFAVWQHLANAGLDSGVYTPSADGNSAIPVSRPRWIRGMPGGNMPSSKFNANEGFMLSYVCGVTDFTFWQNMCGNFFYYGGQLPGGGNNYGSFPLQAVFTTSEAMGIDTKIDDGKPGTGNVLGPKYNGWPIGISDNCTDSGNPSTAKYNVANYRSGKQCGLIFKAQF